jgi:hypothetical protein
VKVGDLVRDRRWYPGRKSWSDKRVGFIRGTYASVGLPDERTINIVWLGGNTGNECEWISEFWLKNVEVISEAR